MTCGYFRPVSRHGYARKVLVSRYGYARGFSVPLENLVSHLGYITRKQQKAMKASNGKGYRGFAENLVSRYGYETMLTICEQEHRVGISRLLSMDTKPFYLLKVKSINLKTMTRSTAINCSEAGL